MLISSDFSAITDCRSMQSLFQAADNIAPNQSDRGAAVTSQCIDSFFLNFVLMLAIKQLSSARIE